MDPLRVRGITNGLKNRIKKPPRRLEAGIIVANLPAMMCERATAAAR